MNDQEANNEDFEQLDELDELESNLQALIAACDEFEAYVVGIDVLY